MSDHPLEEDLPKAKLSKSNILSSSEHLVMESLVRMREDVLYEEYVLGMEDSLDRSQQMVH